jgi:hypothetical protein
MMAIRNGEMPACGGQHEEHDRHGPAVAAARPYGLVRDALERAVVLRDREEERDAGEREEQRARESAHHVAE